LSVADANGPSHGPPTRSVLVTGATGFLGMSLASRLLSDGARVRVLARSPVKAKELEEHGAEVIVGEITDRRAVRAAVDEVAVVYHLAGRLLVPGVTNAEYRRTHVEGTKVLLTCCQEAPSLERFVHCSTTGVLGATGDRPADENAAMRPTNIYEATKAEAELAVRERCEAGFPAVIARPGLVYGPGDLHLLPFFRSVLQRRFRPIGRRIAWLHPIYIDDLTEALLRCGDHDAAVGECFHLAGRDPVPLAELARAIARAGGSRLPAGRIPLPAARAAAALGDRLPAGLKRSAPLTRSRLEFLTHSRIYDVTKAQRALDFTAKIDLPTGAARTMAWYREEGYLPTRATAAARERSGVTAAAREGM
jgi:nucleoside-diphosphate-sugar epimerase